MPQADIFAATGGGGFDEGWVEGSSGGEVVLGGGIHARLCHGIDLGIDLEAAATAEAALRLVVLGAQGDVGAQARVGVRGRVTIDPNLFDTFGLRARVEAAAELSARARLDVGLEAEYIAELAAEHVDGLTLDLFLLFLREVRLGGSVWGKVAYSAMASARLEIAGNLSNDESAGFNVGAGFAVGAKGGAGFDYALGIGFDNPRRFYTASVRRITEEIAQEFRRTLPKEAEPLIEIFRFLVPVGLQTAYEVGQAGLKAELNTADEAVQAFLVPFGEELLGFTIEKAADLAIDLLTQSIETLIAGTIEVTLSETAQSEVEALIQELLAVAKAGKITLDELPIIAGHTLSLAQLLAPTDAVNAQRSLAILWTTLALTAALHEVGTLVGSGRVSFLGLGAGVRARLRPMPPIGSVPLFVLEEYERVIPGYQRTSLTFEDAIDYLIEIGTGPLLAQRASELAMLKTFLAETLDVTPGDMLTAALQGAIGGSLSNTDLYRKLSAFMRRMVDDHIRQGLFEAFDDLSGTDEDARLYVREVARPSVEMMVGFFFERLDAIVDQGDSLTGSSVLQSLGDGMSALLYKLFVQNVVVLEQIVFEKVLEQLGDAFHKLEEAVRADATHDILLVTRMHLARFLPVSIATVQQLDALQEFAATMLGMARELVSDEVFTKKRLKHLRTSKRQLLLSIDGNIDWTSEASALESAIGAIQECSFVPDQDALDRIYAVHVEMLRDQFYIVLRVVPPALADLMLAFTTPLLADLDAHARNFEATAKQSLGAIEAAVASLESAIRVALEEAEHLYKEVSKKLEKTETALKAMDLNLVRKKLAQRCRANIRSIGSQLGIDRDITDLAAKTFMDVPEPAWAPIKPFVAQAIGAVADADGLLQSIMSTAVAKVPESALLSANTSVAYEATVVQSAMDHLRTALVQNFIPANGSPPAVVLTLMVQVGTESVRAIAPIDVIDSLWAALTVRAESLVRNAVVLRLSAEHSRRIAKRKEGVRQQKKAAEAAARRELIAVESDPRASIKVQSPIQVESRLDRIWAYGPVVPLSITVSHARPGWVRDSNARRMQLALNGESIPHDLSYWSYDAEASTLILSGSLRLDGGILQAGLNLLEVSVASADGKRVRECVAFLVDSAGPLPSEKLIVDAAASSFDSAGNDHKSTYDEFVALRWNGSKALSLNGWRVLDRAGHEYTFEGLELAPGALVRLRTGGDPSQDTQTDRHWGRRRAVWNNRGDAVTVIDAGGVHRAHYVYGGRSS